MCTASVFAGQDFRIAATDTGYNVYADGEIVDRRSAPSRLTRRPTGWLCGSGEARCLAWSLAEIDAPTDTEAVRETVKDAGKRAAEAEHEEDQLWSCTSVLTADVDGVGKFDPTGRATRRGCGGYQLLTPPDVRREAEQLDADLRQGLDPASFDASLAAVEETIRRIASISDVTASEYSIGIMRKTDGRWSFDRLNREVR